MVNFTEAWGLTLEVVSVQWRFAQGLDFNSWLWELSAHWVALSRYENSDWSCMHSSNFSSITPTVLDIMEKMWYPIGLTSLMDGHQLSSLKLKLVSTISCWPLWITFFFLMVSSRHSCIQSTVNQGLSLSPLTFASAAHMPCHSLKKHKDCFENHTEDRVEPNLAWSKACCHRL